MEDNIVVKGTTTKNKVATIILIVSIVAIIASFFVADYTFNNLERYKSFGYGYGGYYYYCVIYDFDFMDFYTSEFFSCAYGYMILAGIVGIVVALIMKANTEKCEITVMTDRVVGQIPHGKAVEIPLNQITSIHKCGFNGVSITALSGTSNFYLIQNQEDVVKGISYLLANPGHTNIHDSADATQNSVNGTEAEQLKKLKELLDCGILSQEEFDTKKKQILGL